MVENADLPRVEKITFNGVAAWVKRPEATRSSRFIVLHKILEHLLPRVLHHTGAVGGMDAIRDEAKRLEIFRAASLPVPQILELAEESLTLANAGEQLRSVLKQTSDKTDRYHLLERAVESLCAVHNAKLCHGRPFLKDMTIDAEGKIFWIDLEEDPCKRMSLQDAQARDVWLCLASCAEFCESPLEDIARLLALYKSQSHARIDENLRLLGKQLRPLRRIISVLRIRNISRDVNGAYWSMRALESYA